MIAATNPGRLWIKFPGGRSYPADNCPLDPAEANGFAREGDAVWGPVPSEVVAAPRAATKATKRKASGTGGMFDAKGGER